MERKGELLRDNIDMDLKLMEGFGSKIGMIWLRIETGVRLRDLPVIAEIRLASQ